MPSPPLSLAVRSTMRALVTSVVYRPLSHIAACRRVRDRHAARRARVGHHDAGAVDGDHGVIDHHASLWLPQVDAVPDVVHHARAGEREAVHRVHAHARARPLGDHSDVDREAAHMGAHDSAGRPRIRPRPVTSTLWSEIPELSASRIPSLSVLVMARSCTRVPLLRVHCHAVREAGDGAVRHQSVGSHRRASRRQGIPAPGRHRMTGDRTWCARPGRS